jgi:hypothetical protein
MLLAFGSAKASAAMLGSLTTSMGVFAALAALWALRGWPAGLRAGWIPTSGAMLALAGAAALWRARRWLVPGGAVARLVRARPARAAVALCQARPPAALPAGFDRAELLATARGHFVQLQAAWDAGDMGTLRALTTPDILDDLCCQLPERGEGPNRTDVLTLHAELLGFEDLGPAYLASIEFSGMIRESSHEAAVPFRELWLLARSKDEAAAWRLARQQALL